ncbi:MAG TPA: BamA/TamA family outer membrane protein [Polyangiaceae bacterium]|nr:BamA/TamA family outer membrane protein [Polyangiaceae bacterium]
MAFTLGSWLLLTSRGLMAQAPAPSPPAAGAAAAAPPGPAAPPSDPTPPPAQPASADPQAPASPSAVPVVPPPADRTPAPPPSDAPVAAAAGADVPFEAVRYELEGIEIIGNTKTRRRVVEHYVPFRRGDVLDVDDPALELTRYRLLNSGFFRDVQLSLRKGSARGRVILVIEVMERNTLVVTDLAMGLSADADTDGRRRPLAAFAGVAGAERNLAGTGITLGSALAISQGATTEKAIDQFALRVRFFDPAFLGSRWALSGELLYNDALDFFGNTAVRVDDSRPTSASYATVEYTRSGGQIGFGHPTSLSSRFWLTYRLETIGDVRLPRAASHEYGGMVEPIEFDILPGRSVLSTLRASLEHDTRDHPWLPTRGWLASAALEMSLAPAGSDYPYERLDLRARRWWSLPKNHVVSVDLFAGVIAGQAPFFEQYYVGDLTDFQPGRLLGLNFDRRPAPNFLRTAIEEVRYAEYAFKLNTEYRLPLYRGQRSIYAIDFFGSFGAFVLAGPREINRPAPKYQGLSRIPIDLTGNIGFRLDTSMGGFSFTFSNVLGFLPVRSGEGQ